MNIGITTSNLAYTPEAYAYEKYLSQKGFLVQLDSTLDPNNDINIYFMGLRPFWKRKQGKAIEIHEYQSLSTPPYPRLKDMLKVLINNKPIGRIFLNNIVHKGLFFKDNIPYIYRDMGVDQGFFQKPSENPCFDIIYSGSIFGRVGLVDVLLNLAKNYKVIVVGNISQDLVPILSSANITLAGRVERKDLPELYRNAKFGLNYTPDIYPFNIQTSTKTLEYLASGLQVISNRYEWSERFFSSLEYIPIWLDGNNLELDYKIVNIPHIKKYQWESILDEAGFTDFLMKGLSKNVGK